MHQPQAPSIEQFGLAQTDFDELRNRRFPAPPSPIAFSDAQEMCLIARVLYSDALPIAALVICVLAMALLIFATEGSLGLAVLGGLFAGGFAGLLTMAVLHLGLIPVVRTTYLSVARRLWPAFVRLETYDAAVEAFERKRQEYEQWQLRMRSEFWRSLDGVSFEREVGRLFEGQGYQVQHTARTSDGGVDLVLIRDNRKTVVQCKAHAGRVGIGVGRELVASMQDFGAQEAILVAREGVTLPLKEYAADRGIRVLELDHLLAMQSGCTTPVVLPASDPEEMYRRLMRVKRERSRQRSRATGR